MASTPPAQQPQMPLLYKSLVPINQQQHGDAKFKRLEKVPDAGKAHAVPVTIDEFALLQRHFPIIFSMGEKPVPLALMGLNEGVNTFIDENGELTDKTVQVPAYLRRYPFMLARLKPDSDDLSLCVDPTAEVIGDFKDGEDVFVDGQPGDAIKSILTFCEQFETSAQRTAAFADELASMDLLMDGEVAIQPEGAEQPFVYRGFKMVNEEKLRELPGDKLRKMNQNGMLPLIFAHLFSLSQIREIFARQVKQGNGPNGIQKMPEATA